MLYLIKSYGSRNRSILKVGFTDDIEARKNQYFSHNPFSQVISVREGDLILEGLIHRYLYFLNLQYKHGERLKEWFDNDSEVWRVFHLSRETLERLVWKNRDKIFDMKSPSPFDYSLFEALYKKNINKFERSQYKVVGGKVYKTKAKEVDIDFWNLFIKNEIGNHSIDVGDPIANDFLEKEFYSTGIFVKKMEAFCRFMDSNKENEDVIDLVLGMVDSKFNNYYSLFGTSGCRSVCYRENILEDRLRERILEENIRRKVIEVFEVGKRYSRKDAKGMLKDILDFFGLSRTPKATELEKWLDIKPAFIMLDDGKKDHGFEILGIKPLQNLISE